MEKITSLVLNYIFIFTNETPLSFSKAIGVSEHLVREWCRCDSVWSPNKSETIHIMLYISKHYSEPDIIKVLSYLNYNAKIDENSLNVLEKLSHYSKSVSKKRYSPGIKKILFDNCSAMRIKCDSEDNPSIYEVINSMVV